MSRKPECTEAGSYWRHPQRHALSWGHSCPHGGQDSPLHHPGIRKQVPAVIPGGLCSSQEFHEGREADSEPVRQAKCMGKGPPWPCPQHCTRSWKPSWPPGASTCSRSTASYSLSAPGGLSRSRACTSFSPPPPTGALLMPGGSSLLRALLRCSQEVHESRPQLSSKASDMVQRPGSSTIM